MKKQYRPEMNTKMLMFFSNWEWKDISKSYIFFMKQFVSTVFLMTLEFSVWWRVY